MIWPIPTLDALVLDRNKIIYTDTSVAWETIVWTCAAWLNPVSWRKWDDCRWIYKVVEGASGTEILKPIDPDTSKYFEKWQVRDDRAGYTYN